MVTSQISNHKHAITIRWILIFVMSFSEGFSSHSIAFLHQLPTVTLQQSFVFWYKWWVSLRVFSIYSCAHPHASIHTHVHACTAPGHVPSLFSSCLKSGITFSERTIFPNAYHWVRYPSSVLLWYQQGSTQTRIALAFVSLHFKIFNLFRLPISLFQHSSWYLVSPKIILWKG